jgi:phage-related baseplate assembly protein|nr:MAG TPA: baseplate protein [Caudoviricetes sp.]
MDLIKQGEINSIDVKNGKARVIFLDRDNKVSDWLNILVPFSDSHSDSYNLAVGQSVLVLSLPDMPEVGYILGCPMRASEIKEGEVKRTFSDGGFYSYSNGTLTLNPVSKVVINANTTVNGNLTVSGTTITGGSINLNTHKHDGVTAGGDKTGGPK